MPVGSHEPRVSGRVRPVSQTAKRLLVLVPFPMAEEHLALREAQAADAGLGPNVEIDYRPVRAAPDSYVSHHDYVLADISILEAGLSAEEDGYDAVCIDTVSDSGVAALRSLLDIPVVGPGRIMFATALMLGRRFSILAMWEEWFGLYRKVLADMGITDRCAGMSAIGITPDNRQLLGGKLEEVLPLLHQAAERCIRDDGGEVICLGSTTMHEAHTYLVERLPVPVLNPGPLSYRAAVTMIDLGISHSRLAYPSPRRAKPEMIRAMLRAVDVSRES
jgi:allantoin racemase